MNEDVKERYRTILLTAISTIAAQQTETKAQIDESNHLIEEINILNKLLDGPILQKPWFDHYLRVYTSNIRNKALKAYTDPIRAGFESIWHNLGISEKTEVAKSNDSLYIFPNMTTLSPGNFEARMKVKYEKGIKLWLTGDLLENYAKKYDGQLGGMEHSFKFTGKEEAFLVLSIRISPKEIRLIISNNGIDLQVANGLLLTFLHLLYQER
jgi:hypothetical protein